MAWKNADLPSSKGIFRLQNHPEYLQVQIELAHTRNEASSLTLGMKLIYGTLSYSCRFIVYIVNHAIQIDPAWGDRQLSFIVAYPSPGTLVTTVYKHTPTPLLTVQLLQNHILRLFSGLISSHFCMFLLKATELCTQRHSHDIDYTARNSLVKVSSSYA